MDTTNWDILKEKYVDILEDVTDICDYVNVNKLYMNVFAVRYRLAHRHSTISVCLKFAELVQQFVLFTQQLVKFLVGFEDLLP